MRLGLTWGRSFPVVGKEDEIHVGPLSLLRFHAFFDPSGSKLLCLVVGDAVNDWFVENIWASFSSKMMGVEFLLTGEQLAAADAVCRLQVAPI